MSRSTGNGKLDAASALISSGFSFQLALRPTKETLSPYCLCRSASGARACTTYGHLHERKTSTAPLTPLAFVNDSSARASPESTVRSEKPGALAPARGPAGGAAADGVAAGGGAAAPSGAAVPARATAPTEISESAA